MNDVIAAAELLTRSGVAAINLLIAAQLARTRPMRLTEAAGILLCVGTAAYALVSGSNLPPGLKPAREGLIFFAVLNPVFLWWFALALFRDPPAWRHVYAAPLGLFLVYFVLRYVWSGWTALVGGVAHQLAIGLLLAHIVSLALIDLKNDLVDARRRFRVAIALALPIMGFIIMGAELYSMYGDLPAWLAPIQAAALFGLSFIFGLWLTEARQDLIGTAVAPQPAASSLGPADLIELEQLKAAVARGVCLEPDLSLGSLARQLDLPEHRLRRLISKGLGYRNFAAFVHDHRIAEAKRVLADPAKTREQIASIAYGLGYASLAPFNKAFRQQTGVSPSEYRERALTRALESGKG